MANGRTEGPVVIRIARDVEELKQELKRAGVASDKRLKRLEDSFGELMIAVKGIQITQSALTNALTSTLSEIALSRKLEGRVERLESAVFRKHQARAVRGRERPI